MTAAVYGLSAIFFLAAFASYLWVLTHAFRRSMKMGLLCLFFPPFLLFYYAFSRFQHRRKKPILIVGILGGVLGLTGLLIAPMFADSEEQDEQDSLADW